MCLAAETDELIAQVNVTKSEGAVGVYDQTFMALEDKLAQVNDIISNFNESEDSMASTQASFEDIRCV